MDETMGRGVAGVGVVLSFVAIWLTAITGSKYSDDGTHVVWLILLCVVAAGLLLSSFMSSNARHARLAMVPGALLLGFYAWVPALAAFGHLGDVGAGGWLGLAGGVLAFVGAWLGSQSQGTAPSLPTTMGE